MIQPGRPGGERVGTDRFETFLRRLFSVKGVVAPSIEPQLNASLDVLGAPEEYYFAQGLRPFATFLDLGPQVGLFTYTQLANPAGSGHIVVVSLVQMFSSGGESLLFRWDGPGGGTSMNYGWRESRFGVTAGAAIGATVMTFSSVAAITGQVAGALVGAQGAVTQTERVWVIAPGRNLTIWQSAVNLQYRVAVAFHERPCEPSEL